MCEPQYPSWYDHPAQPFSSTPVSTPSSHFLPPSHLGDERQRWNSLGDKPGREPIPYRGGQGTRWLSALCLPTVSLQDTKERPTGRACPHPHWWQTLLLPLLPLSVGRSQQPSPPPTQESPGPQQAFQPSVTTIFTTMALLRCTFTFSHQSLWWTVPMMNYL